MINISSIIDLSINGQKLLENTQLTISNGDKYGLIGKNGIGKTSLLNYIYQLSSSNIDVYMVNQELKVTDDTVINYILKSNQKRCDLMNKYDKLNEKINNNPTDELLKEFKEITEKMNEYEIDKDESKIKKILHGLGFSIDEYTKPVTYFSGGWKMRISLATALFNKPELLLLDEPTNHLDIETVETLIDSLKTFNGGLLLITHEPELIKQLSNEIWVLNKETHKIITNIEDYEEYCNHIINNKD